MSSKMAKLKSLSASTFIVLTTLLIMVFGFTYYGISQSLLSSAEPEVILMGSPTEVPSSLKSKLPTGYSWVAKQQIPTDFPNVDGDSKEELKAFMNDPRIVYRLDIDLDLEEGIKFAKENGKEQIYLLYVDTASKNMVPLSLEDGYKLLLESIESKIENLSIILDPFTITEAFASSVPSPTCTTGIITIPANTCVSSKGGTRDYCFKYSSKDCHWVPWITHANNNMDSHGASSNVNNSSPIAFTRAMSALGTSMQAISGLTIDIHKKNTDSGFLDPVNGCGQLVSACGDCPNCGQINKPSPRTHAGTFIILADNTTRNNWSVVRHELAHNYNYQHCEMELNIDNVSRSINSAGAGTTVPNPNPPFTSGCHSIGLSDCRHNTNVCSVPGPNNAFPNNIFN